MTISIQHLRQCVSIQNKLLAPHTCLLLSNTRQMLVLPLPRPLPFSLSHEEGWFRNPQCCNVNFVGGGEEQIPPTNIHESCSQSTLILCLCKYPCMAKNLIDNSHKSCYITPHVVTLGHFINKHELCTTLHWVWHSKYVHISWDRLAYRNPLGAFPYYLQSFAHGELMHKIRCS